MAKDRASFNALIYGSSIPVTASLFSVPVRLGRPLDPSRNPVITHVLQFPADQPPPPLPPSDGFLETREVFLP